VLVYSKPSNDVFVMEFEWEEITTASIVLITEMEGRVVESFQINPNITLR
jgi:hypothetical protein